MTFALCEKEGSVGVVGLETADAFTDGVTSLDAEEKVSNKSAISDVRSDLEINEWNDELTLLDPLMLPLCAFPNCGSIKYVINNEKFLSWIVYQKKYISGFCQNFVENSS